MTRWRRLLRAKSSIDLTIVALVLCVCLFVFRHLNQRAAAHRQTTGEEAYDDTTGQLLEISVSDERQQQQQQLLQQAAGLPSPDARHSSGRRAVDQRIMHIGDFRSADCRSVSN